MIAQNLFQCVSTELHAGLQVQILTEREATQIIALHNVTQFQIFLFQSHYGRTGEYDFEVRETIVAHSQFSAPVRVFKHLVYQ